ncbi:hypothetical protein BGZ81_005152 [Podila clonocystis]|nr:hypothetical protein BGZ81_005152 [Podila clonocystis]
MDDRKRKHAHKGDKPKAKRQTRSMAHPAVLGSVSTDRKGKSVLKRSKSDVHDSAPNGYTSDSEVYVSVSDSSDEYVPQEVDDAPRSSRVPSKKCEEQERSWGTKDSSNRSSGDSAVHQIKSSSRYDMECETNANPTTSSRKPLSNKPKRTPDRNHSNKNSRNSSSSGRKNLSSSSKLKTAKLAKSKARKYVKTERHGPFKHGMQYNNAHA